MPLLERVPAVRQTPSLFPRLGLSVCSSLADVDLGAIASHETLHSSTRRLLLLPSGTLSCEHDVLGVVFHIALVCFQLFIHLGILGI